MAVGSVLLVRHGAVDYANLTSRKPVYDGGRYDFAPLSWEGVRQTQRLVSDLRAHHPDLAGGLIVSSPYTRTLHTAGILAAGLRCQLAVDLDLHDWLPVRDGRQPLSANIVASKIAEYEHWKISGTLPPNPTWETDDEMKARLLTAVDRHDTGHGLIVVTHEAVIKSVVPVDHAALASWHVLRTNPTGDQSMIARGAGSPQNDTTPAASSGRPRES